MEHMRIKKDHQSDEIEECKPFLFILMKVMKYHQYLELTLENLPDYGDIKDIVSRYETLKQTNIELSTRATETNDETERCRLCLETIHSEKHRLILSYNNTLSKNQALLEAKQTARHRQKVENSGLTSQKQERSLLVSQIKLAVSNLYGISQKYLQKKVSTQIDTQTQLKEIQVFCTDLEQNIFEVQNNKEI